MAKKRRRKNLMGEPIYGEGLRVLIVNDIRVTRGTFADAMSGARIELYESAQKAIKRIRASKRSGKLFNAIFIDKNLGDRTKGKSAQDVISAIERLSPNSHICIHSAETGPGELAKFPFVSFLGDQAQIKRVLRRFIAMVEKQPFRKVPSGIDLSVLKRPIPVLTRGGSIKVFYLVEGSQLPKHMEQMISEGGRVLSIPEAIRLDSRISSARDRSALLLERVRTEQIWREAQKTRNKRAKQITARKRRR